MIITGTRLSVADNSNARTVQCIGIPGTNNPKTAHTGDIITVAVQSVRKVQTGGTMVKTKKSGMQIAKGSIAKALIIRTKKHPQGGCSFGDNSVILRNSKGDLRGTRISGPRLTAPLYKKGRWKAVAMGVHLFDRSFRSLEHFLFKTMESLPVIVVEEGPVVVGPVVVQAVLGSSALLLTRILPLLGIGLLLLRPTKLEKQVARVKKVALRVTFLTFLVSQRLWILFDQSTAQFQFVTLFQWNEFSSVHPSFGVDGISMLFILLTTFLIPLCLLASWESVKKDVKGFCISFLLLESALCLVFSVLDLLLFYVFFETILLPRFLLIGIWGSRTRKIRAAYQFFLYTLLGSLFRLVGIVRIAFQTGTTDFQILCILVQQGDLWSGERQLLLFLAFFASFAVKVPRVPFHLWLPEAHVEAPTAGSVLLAGVLLKLGTYGFIRFSLPLFPEASAYCTPLIYTRSVVAIIYTSRTTLRQVDLKKIVAYSSVAHRGFVTMGIFTMTIQGREGALLIMLSHGFVSSALFLCIGVLYDRHHTRLLKYYSGLIQTRPLFGTVFVFFTLANLGFPGTSSFPGEFLSLIGAAQSSVTVTILASIGMVLGAVYSIWLCNRLLFGGSSATKLEALLTTTDLTGREMATFAPLIFCTVWFGVYPTVVLSVRHSSVAHTLYPF